MKTTLRIRNFKSLEDVTIEIKPLTLLFGPNGSGKSSIMKAIRFFCANVQYSLFTHQFQEEKTLFYFPNINLNLGSYEDIVIGNDVKKNIMFDLNISFDGEKHYNKVPVEESLPKMDFQISAVFKKDSQEFKLIDLSDGSYSISRNKGNIKLYSKSPETIYTEIKFGNDWIDELFADFFNSKPLNSFIKGFQTPAFFKEQSLEEFIGSITSSEKWLKSSDSERELIQSQVETKMKLFGEMLSIVQDICLTKYLGGIRELPEFGWLPVKVQSERVYYGIPDHALLRLKDENSDVPLSRNYSGIQLDILKKIVKIVLIEHRKSGRGGVKLEISENKMIEIYLKGEEFRPMHKINSYIRELNFGEGIFAINTELWGISVYLLSDNGVWINIKEASSGFLQVLPILTIITYFEDYLNDLRKDWQRNINDIIMIEQPELHLHPKLQAKLAEIFIDASRKFNKNIILETHSEHLVRKLQVLFAKGEIDRSELVVYYLDFKDNKTQIKEMEMEDNGFFKEPWPDGFFDDSYNLARELIYARKN